MDLYILAHIDFSTQLGLKKHAFVKLTLFFDFKTKLIQTKMIPFSKYTFKTKVMLARALFMILLRLAVNIQNEFGWHTFLSYSFYLHALSSLKVYKLFYNLEGLAQYSAEIYYPWPLLWLKWHENSHLYTNQLLICSKNKIVRATLLRTLERGIFVK